MASAKEVNGCSPARKFDFVQDLLVIGIGKFVVVLNISHVATPGEFNVDVPVECRMESPLRGVHVIGQHDDDVTEIASCASGTTNLATASKDGTVSLITAPRGAHIFGFVANMWCLDFLFNQTFSNFVFVNALRREAVFDFRADIGLCQILNLI